MKVKQVVGEHKKGVRAHKYTKKPVNPSAVHAKAKEKFQPIKPMEDLSAETGTATPGTAEQGTVVATDDKSITVQMPDGTQVKKDLINGAITTDDNGNPIFQAGTATAQSGTANTQQAPQQKLAPGTRIAVNTQPPQQTMGQPARPMGEAADNVLLDKMLTIAGLR